MQSRVISVSGPVDGRIAAIAAAQEGRVARWQLLEAGASSGQVQRRIGADVLVPEHNGVYAYGHPTTTQHSEEIAALLTRFPGAVVCAHRAAGVYRFRPMCEGVDLLVHAQHSGTTDHRGIRIRRTTDARSLEPTWVDGIPVVAPAVALLQVAGDLGPRALEVALDEAFSTGRINRDEVRAVVEAHPNAPGVGVLRQLLRRRLVGNPSGSPGQEVLLGLIREARLPDPKMDAPIGGGFTADSYWPDARVAAEYDSFTWHSSRSAWARDRRKDRHCAEVGIELVRATDEDLTSGRLALIARLAGLIAARGALRLQHRDGALAHSMTN